MRKSILILLLFILGCSLAFPAGAETVPYLMQTDPVNLSPTVSLESYPEICLTTVSDFDSFGESKAHKVKFVVFPTKDSIPVESFSKNDADFWDTASRTHYEYETNCATSRTDFLKGVSSAAIVYDDPDTRAVAYVSTKQYSAFGYIPLRGMGEKAALKIQVFMHGLNDLSASEQKAKLEEAVTAEMDRLKSKMHYEEYADWWSFNKFCGVKMRCAGSPTYLLQIDFPDPSALGFQGDGTGISITAVDGTFNGLDLVFQVKPGIYVKANIGFNTVAIVKGSSDDYYDFTRVKLENGST